MTPEPAPQKSSVLSPESFGRFLDWLSPDHEIAARQYLEIRKKLVQLFIRRGCAHSEDLADTTLDRAAMIVYHQPEKYSNPLALCCGVARKVWLEYLRDIRPEPLETDNIPVFDRDDSRVREHEANCLGNCVQRLSRQEHDFIVQYHQFRGREKIELRKRLAEQYGGLNKLRITAHRIRARLNDCISGCVQRASANLVNI
jgi:DNA-directed RNA polymerase specialized sigma24 family protein